MNTQAGIQNAVQLLQAAGQTVPTIGALIDDNRTVEDIKVVVANDLKYRGAPAALPLAEMLVDIVIAAATPAP